MSVPEEYAVKSLIGRGAFGTVYQCYKKNNKNDFVAIKIISRREISRGTGDNIVREIEILKTLQHENIVTLLDFTWDKSYVYLIMELCDGGSFSDFITQRRRVPEPLARKFFRQLAHAVCFMHSQGVSHFDLKPHNLLIKRQPIPTLKVADFGLAKHSRDISGSDLRGSLQYMAPEILLRRQLDPKSDLWSCGLILYEALYGCPLFYCPDLNFLIETLTSFTRVDLPPYPRISENGQSVLRLLVEPKLENRIGFTDFAQHPFVDLQHVPTKDSMRQAVDLVTQAVSLDKAGSYKQAMIKYKDAVEFFNAALDLETRPEAQDAIRHKVAEYAKRAEFLAHRHSTSSWPEGCEITTDDFLSDNDLKAQASGYLGMLREGDSCRDSLRVVEAIPLYEGGVEGLLALIPRTSPVLQQKIKPLIVRYLDRLETVKELLVQSKTEENTTYCSVM